MSNEILALLGVILGSGTLGTCMTVFFNHKSKTDATKLAKDEKAFEVLEGRIRYLEDEMKTLKAELRVKDELVDQLKEENILLKFENKELKDTIAELKGEK